MATTLRETGYTFDTLLELLDSQTIAADDNAQVDGSDQIIDLGADAEFRGDMVVDISALEIASNDELFEFILEGSDSASHASGIEEVARLHVGANEVLNGNGDVDSDAGRYVVPFRNERNGRRYRYLRLRIEVAGTIATGVTAAAYIAKSKS